MAPEPLRRERRPGGHTAGRLRPWAPEGPLGRVWLCAQPPRRNLPRSGLTRPRADTFPCRQRPFCDDRHRRRPTRRLVVCREHVANGACSQSFVNVWLSFLLVWLRPPRPDAAPAATAHPRDAHRPRRLRPATGRASELLPQRGTAAPVEIVRTTGHAGICCGDPQRDLRRKARPRRPRPPAGTTRRLCGLSPTTKTLTGRGLPGAPVADARIMDAGTQGRGLRRDL